MDVSALRGRRGSTVVVRWREDLTNRDEHTTAAIRDEVPLPTNSSGRHSTSALSPAARVRRRSAAVNLGDLLTHAAARAPGRRAVTAESLQLTYTELNA